MPLSSGKKIKIEINTVPHRCPQGVCGGSRCLGGYFNEKNKTVFENSLVFIIFYILFLRKIGILLVHKLFNLFFQVKP